MGDLVWDDRLMSRDEFWELTAPLQVRPGVRRGLVFIDCGLCGQAVLPLGTIRTPFATSVERIGAAVLRHRVSAHDMPLNQRRKKAYGDLRGADGGLPDSEPAAAGRGNGHVRPRADPARRRPAAEAAGRRREPGAAGGDQT